jgi:hypothetical protein
LVAFLQAHEFPGGLIDGLKEEETPLSEVDEELLEDFLDEAVSKLQVIAVVRIGT